MKKRVFKKPAITLALLSVFLYAGYRVAVAVKGQDNINIVIGLVKQRLGGAVDLEKTSAAVAIKYNNLNTGFADVSPFKEIGNSLGGAAKSNNLITVRGVTAFDANGDGRQDLFFPHSGRPVARAVNEKGILNMEKRVDAKPCVLYINKGNDENGDPIYISVQDEIARQGNKFFVEEELLIENKYLPRNNIKDDPYGEGRVAYGSVAADFNGDGRVDLMILNGHWGASFTVPGMGVRVYPGANHLGRVDKDNLEYIEALLPEFLKADLKDGGKLTYNGEPEGLNTLFLNKGDKDKDGLPEWENVTEAVGFNTNYTSFSGTVSDIDRDGDLDLYVSNFLDPDFWGFGRETFAGNRNTLWINQLSETGKFTFKEQAAGWGVTGLIEEESLDASLLLPNGTVLKNPNKCEFDGEPVGENAAHTWTSLFVDFNEDSYPDLIVANDIPNRLRVYKNVEGKSFERVEYFDDPKWIGCWMGVAYGDLNGDRKPEMMLANCGSNVFSVRNTNLLLADQNELNIQSVCQLNALKDNATWHQSMLAVNKGNFKDISNQVHVRFNELTAPDICNRNNVNPMAYDVYDKYKFGSTITGLEFSWNPSFFDLDNDGDLDIYTVGALSRGNDNFIGDFSGGPGRLLINNSTPERFDFADRTFEYQLFDIALLDYNANPARRPSPGTGWHKEDFIYFTDRDAYAGVGYEVTKTSEVKDIFRMHEAANGHIAADLNNDGKIDIIVPHGAGYNSLSPEARNLKVDFMGKALAVPPPNKIVKAPTTFEEGATFIYINQEEGNNWAKIQLENNFKSNLYGIGARVIINENIERHVLLGGQTMSGIHEPLHVGLGDGQLEKVEVYWPDGGKDAQVFKFNKAVKKMNWSY